MNKRVLSGAVVLLFVITFTTFVHDMIYPQPSQAAVSSECVFACGMYGYYDWCMEAVNPGGGYYPPDWNCGQGYQNCLNQCCVRHAAEQAGLNNGGCPVDDQDPNYGAYQSYFASCVDYGMNYCN